MNGNDQFFRLLDEAGGQGVSKVNDLLVKALDRMHPSDPARIYVQRAAEMNSELGDKKLKALETWGKGDGDIKDESQKPAQMRPGTTVADAGTQGEDIGRGNVEPSSFSLGNWSFYQQRNLGKRWADIFAGPLSGVNSAIGALPGNLATATQDPIVRDSNGAVIADLRKWL